MRPILTPGAARIALRVAAGILATSTALAAPACGGDTAKGARDTQARDTSPAPDVVPPDTAPTGTAPTDTAPTDTGPIDTGGPEAQGDGHIQILDEPIPPPPPPGEELPVEVVRNFECLEQNVGAELVVAPVVGADGDVLAIRPSGVGGCQYNLVYKAADGTVTTLANAEGQGSGYLFAAAVRQGDTTIACSSNIHHRADGAGATRYVEAVTLECAARTSAGGRFGLLTPVVVPDTAWAAWIRTLEPDAAHAGTFRLRYVRDFTFHIFNLSDHGRPGSDGIYEVVLTLAGNVPKAGAPAKIADKTNPLAGNAFEAWNPSDADRAVMSEFIDFSDGPCPNGCPLPEAPGSP